MSINQKLASTALNTWKLYVEGWGNRSPQHVCNSGKSKLGNACSGQLERANEVIKAATWSTVAINW